MSCGCQQFPCVCAPSCALQRNRLDFVAWLSRDLLLNGGAGCQSYLYSIAPYGTNFLIYPPLNDETDLLLIWEGIKSNFADGDIVPFPEEAAEAVAAYVKSRIAMVVDKNPAVAAEEMGFYKLKRLALYRDYQEKQDAEKPDEEYVLSQLPPPGDPFANTGAQVVPFLSAITQLEGTIDAALANIPTAGLTTPYLVDILIGGNLQRWMLEASTAADNPGLGVVRPNDYADTTNEKCWIILT